MRRLRVSLHERRARVHGGGRGAPDGLRRVARADDVLVLGDRVDERAVGRPGVLQLVDHHEGEPGRDLAPHVGALAQQPLELDHQVAAVEAPVLAQDPVVAGVELRELHARGGRAPSPAGSPTRARAPRPSREASRGGSPRPSGRRSAAAGGRAGPRGCRGSRGGAGSSSSRRSRRSASRSASLTVAKKGSRPASSAYSHEQALGGRLIGGDPELLVGRLHQRPGARPAASPRPRASGSGSGRTAAPRRRRPGSRAGARAPRCGRSPPARRRAAGPRGGR